MSDTAKTLLGTFGMTDFLIPLVLSDLSEEDARTRSRDGEGPSITWIVGHLLHYRLVVMSMLGHERADSHGARSRRPRPTGANTRPSPTFKSSGMYSPRTSRRC